jgi:hypothetical protein
MSIKTQFFIIRFVVAQNKSLIFILYWGWYKVCLWDNAERAKKRAFADKALKVVVFTIFTLEYISGVLCIVTLPEDYRNSGVYNGTYYGILLGIYSIFLVVILVLLTRLANKIAKMLSINTGGKTPIRVATDKTTRNRSNSAMNEQARIYSMIKKVKVLVGIGIFFFILDCGASIGNYVHIVKPLCSKAKVYLRVTPTKQIVICFGLIWGFPITKFEDIRKRVSVVSTLSSAQSDVEG